MGLPVHNRKALVDELRRRILAKYRRQWQTGDADDRISFGDPHRGNPQAFDRDRQTNHWLELTRRHAESTNPSSVSSAGNRRQFESRVRKSKSATHAFANYREI